MGIMGAVLGGLNFKLNEWTTERARLAEEAKLARLEQIEMAKEQRADQRQIASDERQHGYRMTELDSRQQHEVALVGLNHEYKTVEQALAAGYTMQQIQLQGDQAMARTQVNEAGATQRAREQNETTIKAAELRTNDDSRGMYGTDGVFYPVGTPMPAGVTPTVGYGATNLGVRGAGAGTPGRPGAATAKPAFNPNGWSGAIEN